MVDTPVVVTPPPASPAPATPPALPGRPSRARYILVALLPLVALAAVLFWFFSVNEAVNAKFDQFTRGSVPGQATVWVNPGTWYVYASSESTIDSVRVTGPSGQPLAVDPSSAASVHGARGGRDFRAVGQFIVGPPQVGNAQVSVAGTGLAGEVGYFAVGDFDVNGFQAPQFWAMGVLLAVNVVSATAIAVWPIVRVRRMRRSPA